MKEKIYLKNNKKNLKIIFPKIFSGGIIYSIYIIRFLFAKNSLAKFEEKQLPTKMISLLNRNLKE